MNKQNEARKLARAQDRVAASGYRAIRREIIRASEYASRQYPRDISFPDDFAKRLSIALSDVQSNAAMLGVTEIRKALKSGNPDLETKFDWSALALRFFDEFSGMFLSQKITRIQESTRKRIASIVRTATIEGASGDALSRRIVESAKVFSRGDAARIARTEVHGMFGYSSTKTAEMVADDAVMEREWISVEDERTREAHDAANGQRQPFGMPFLVGGEYLQFPGDPNGSAGNVINCRCVAITVLK